MSFQRTNLDFLVNRPRSTNYLKAEKKEKVVKKTENEKEKKKGPYASIPQKYYQPVKEKKSRSEGEFIIDEEVYAKEISPGQIYNFNLGIEDFSKYLDQVRDKSPKIQILDNYYLYQYIHSVKDGIPISYSEKELSHQWIPDRQVYQRKIKRIYDHQNKISDLDSYQEYHLIVRIIRFQLHGKIFEIIIPRQNTDVLPYQVSPKFWDLLVDKNFKILNFPSGTNFMIRQSL